MLKSLKSKMIVVFGAYIFVALAVIVIIASRMIVNTAENFAITQGAPVVSTLSEHIDGDRFEAFLKVM